MSYAVMMNGYSASLKRYIARSIAKSLKIPLIETTQFGPGINNDRFLKDTLRDKRYEIATDVAACIAKRQLPMVLEGTFSFRRWRKPIYQKLVGENIYQIDDTCNLDRRRKRSWKRDLDEHGPEGILASLKYKDVASCMLGDLIDLGVEVVADSDTELPKNLEAKLDEVVEKPNEESSESSTA